MAMAQGSAIVARPDAEAIPLVVVAWALRGPAVAGLSYSVQSIQEVGTLPVARASKTNRRL